MSDLFKNSYGLAASSYGKDFNKENPTPYIQNFKIPEVGITDLTDKDYGNLGYKSSFKDATEESPSNSFLGMDKGTLGNIAGLAGAATSIFATLDNIKTAKLNREGMQFNLDTARERWGNFQKSYKGFNSFDTSNQRMS